MKLIAHKNIANISEEEEKKEIQSDFILGTNVENFSEEKLEKRWNELDNTEDWDDECEMCKRPVILHIRHCEKKRIVGEDEYREIWREWCSLFGKMESIRKRKEDQEEKKETQIISD